MKTNNLHTLYDPCRVYKGQFQATKGAHHWLKSAQFRPERGPSKVKWVKTISFLFLGAGSLDQGALPWLISPPSLKFWLRHRVWDNLYRVPIWKHFNLFPFKTSFFSGHNDTGFT